jgi:hypothetical protein
MLRVLTSCLLLISINAVSQVPKNIRAVPCEPPQAYTFLDVNNVRARINSGGDMWWDLQGDPEYEIPAGSGIHTVFAGSLWMGGYDENNQLYLAANRFRQVGTDYATGPLKITGADQATADIDVCRNFDGLFEITREQVREFRKWYDCNQNPDCNHNVEFENYTIPDIIINWPAHGPEGGYDYYLAPFWDSNNDGVYNPYDGDFPFFEFIEDSISSDYNCLKPRNKPQQLMGDKSIWWVFNDGAKEHTETGGNKLGMEIHAQAFAYATADVVNDMTFYNYYLINRSTNTYSDFRVGLWTDIDLGGALDDYIGCDVQRGLGYAYNGDDFDDDASGNLGYGNNPPAMGFDFLEGLFADPDFTDNSSSYDTINGHKVLNCSRGDVLNGNVNGQNFGDGVVDNERLGMGKFMYMNYMSFGGGPGLGYSFIDQTYMNFLSGIWYDGQNLCYGGFGHPAVGGDINVPTSFMFPGNPTTDICGIGQNGQLMPGWSEETVGNYPDDRRFVMSSGPVTMQPGEVNSITIGAIYGRSYTGSAWASVEVMKQADDVAQNLFDNCFRLITPPDEPKLDIVELDQKLIFNIYNNAASNNYLEQYKHRDWTIYLEDTTVFDPYYTFQGYQIFQLKNEHVDFEKERYNQEKVQLIFQCDIKDDIGSLNNYYWNQEINNTESKIEVQAENNGIVHSFVLDKDAFPWANDNSLINYKKYHFVVVAYAANKGPAYNPQDPTTISYVKTPYLRSKNPEVYTAYPHSVLSEGGGTILNSDYRQGVSITQLEGNGNGYNVLELSDESMDEIMSGTPWRANEPNYKEGYGPINIRVIDPLNVKDDTYTFKMMNAENWTYGWIKEGAEWILINSNNDTIYSDYTFSFHQNEQIIPEWGIAVQIGQVHYPGYKNRNDVNNGLLEAEIIFENEDTPWLSFVPDGDNFDHYNWIRCGEYENKEGESSGGSDQSYNDHLGYDPDEYYENILGGTWAPYVFASTFKYGPAEASGASYARPNIHKYYPITSVDLVITSEKSKWTRACVVEMCENEWTVDDDGYPIQVQPLVNYLSEGNALRFALRKSPSVDKEGQAVSGDTTYGMGWFPGYAIDVRTGERLNIAFGEDSWLVGENGKDMLWNPSENIENNFDPVFGGKHYIYILGHTQNFQNPVFQAPAYDSCKWFYEKLYHYDTSNIEFSLRQAWATPIWTAIPIHNSEYDFMACDVKIRLRVANPYQKGIFDYAVDSAEMQNDNFPAYRFTLSDYSAESNLGNVNDTILNRIMAVPNPYTWYSYYDAVNYDYNMKLINLPEQCVVTIYNVSGRIVKRIDKNDTNTFIVWDLTDLNNDLIRSGTYIIHLSCGNYGEKVLKWCAVMRE